MRTVAILPIKSFGAAKRRLAEELDDRSRRALAEAMVCDVLAALRRTRSVDEVLVVSADAGARRVARAYGASALDDEEAGHNAAARRGIAVALAAGASRVLLVPGDCPMVDPLEVEALLARLVSGRSALIVPDRHGTGTNALLLAPPQSLEPSFGPGSCRRHRTSAEAGGTRAEVVDIPSLALDADTPEDLDALLAALAETHGGVTHTRGVMRRLMPPRA